MRNSDRFYKLLIIFCALGIAACCAYLIYNYYYLPRSIAAENARWAAMYEGHAASPSPTASPTPTVSLSPTMSATPAVSPSATVSPTVTIEATATARVVPRAESFDVIDDIAYGTAGPDTLVIAAPTLPPINRAFDDLIAENPETVGFITIGDWLKLPVAQKKNDNEYYLAHSFDGDKSKAGCLFLDGSNRLFPGDECLFIYGHNMKNGTMFGELSRMAEKSVLMKNPVVCFDSIYRDGLYVPFACFSLSANQSKSDYFELRRFVFDDTSFADYVSYLKRLSVIDIPVDVARGDELVMLITCSYSIDDGRFVLALRRLRDDESEDYISKLISASRKK